MVAAFNLLFDKVLSWKQGDDIVLIYDEEFYPFMEAFNKVVIERSADVIYMFVPVELQRALIVKAKKHPADAGKVLLSERMKANIRDADIILSVLNGDLSTQVFRKAVLFANRGSKGAKLAHIPGLSKHIIDLLGRTPFDIVESNCELLAWALGQSRQITIETYGRKREVYQLVIRKDGWNDSVSPQISSGIIQEGSWGNVPPGESFICPDPSHVSGQICINGSIHDHILRRGEEFVLDFQDGQAGLPIMSKSAKVNKHFKKQELDATRSNDTNWNVFAEFGIGANPAINSLTGNMLFDEKMANTIHVAIGDSTVFGGSTWSNTHEDMVVRGASVTFDSFQAIVKGNVNYDMLKLWKASDHLYGDLEIGSRLVKDIRRANIKFSGSTMYRCVESRKRVSCIVIGEGTISEAVKEIFSKAEENQKYSVADLQKFITVNIDVTEVIKFMLNYHLLMLDTL